MSLEEKILKYKETQEQIKKLEEEKKKAYEEILNSFTPDKDEIFSKSFRVKKHSSIKIKINVTEARAFQATKKEEVVDKEKIKELVSSGVCVPNVTESAYFFIHDLEKESKKFT
jgi:hypothetical protein